MRPNLQNISYLFYDKLHCFFLYVSVKTYKHICIVYIWKKIGVCGNKFYRCNFE